MFNRESTTNSDMLLDEDVTIVPDIVEDNTEHRAIDLDRVGLEIDGVISSENIEADNDHLRGDDLQRPTIMAAANLPGRRRRPGGPRA